MQSFDEVILQNSLCIWQTQSELASSLFYTQEYKVASYKEGQVVSPEDEEQWNKNTSSQYLLPTQISALSCGRAYLFLGKLCGVFELRKPTICFVSLCL